MDRAGSLKVFLLLLLALLFATAAFAEKAALEPTSPLSVLPDATVPAVISHAGGLPAALCCDPQLLTAGTKRTKTEAVVSWAKPVHEEQGPVRRAGETHSVQEAEAEAGSGTVHISIRGDEKQVALSGTPQSPEMPGPDQIVHPTNAAAQSAIEQSLHLFSVRIRERFSIWLERSSKYMGLMREILREKQLPEELVFLPFVESGFNVNAYSRARAVGAWQFIEATAKRYGLVVDWWQDERKDPVKSTEAAASYLRDLYKMFGSWNLALAAYNAGEGRIMKALRRSDADDYWSLLRTRQIRDETKNYVPQYYAARLIAYSPEEFGFSNIAYQEPIEFDEVVIDRPLDVEVIASCSLATVPQIKDLNPSLRRWSTPPNVDRYTVRIPRGTKEIFFENLAVLPDEECFSYDTYKVRKGETIKGVAKKLNIPVSVVLELNDLNGLEQLKPGSELRIPPKDKFLLDLDDRISAKRASLDTKSPTKAKKTSRKTTKHQDGKTPDKIKVKRA